MSKRIHFCRGRKIFEMEKKENLRMTDKSHHFRMKSRTRMIERLGIIISFTSHFLHRNSNRTVDLLGFICSFFPILCDPKYFMITKLRRKKTVSGSGNNMRETFQILSNLYFFFFLFLQTCSPPSPHSSILFFFLLNIKLLFFRHLVTQYLKLVF